MSRPAHTLADRLAEQAARHGSGYIRNHEPSFWLRTRLTDLGARLASGQAHPCPHLQTPDQAGVMALWQPDVVACADCLEQFRLGGDADRTCDRCSAVVPTIHPNHVAAAPNVLVMFGLCPACQRKEAGR